MANKRRCNLSLNLNKPQHRQAWAYLANAPQGRRTDFICEAIIEKMQVDRLRTMLREELSHISVPLPPPQTKTQNITDDVLGFLQSL